MAVVRLKGLNSARVRLKDGREVVYWYAWKGGPRLHGSPGSPEFIAGFNAAVAGRRAQPADTLAGLVTRYKASPDFTGLADATRAGWRPWLDRISETEGPLAIGGLPLRLLDDRRVREDLLAWRDQWADRPRSADYAIQVLGRVLSFGLDRGILALNAAARVRQLYESDRADQIWTDAELEAFRAAAPSPEVAAIAPLACLTGLRLGDLTKLSWSHVGDVALVIPTGKSRGRRTQTIPILPQTRQLLAEIRLQQQARHVQLAARARKKNRPPPPAPTTVLSNTRGTPWTASGLQHQVIDTKAAAKPAIDKHLHDARGTFGTRLRRAGLTASEIADVLGWDEKRVQRLLATYVDRDAIVMGLAERIRKNEGDGR